MSTKASIRLPNELTIKSALPNSTLVSGDEQNGPALGIECKCNTPYPTRRAKRNSFMLAWSEPLSVSTSGRPSVGPFAKVQCQCNQFFLNGLRKLSVFRQKLIVKNDFPLLFHFTASSRAIRRQ